MHDLPAEHGTTGLNVSKGALHREKSAWNFLSQGVLQLEDGATNLLKLIRLRLGKDLQQDVCEHDKRFLHRSARLYQQSMQHYIAEDSNLHERALQAVRSVSTPGKDEPETKEIIADVLLGFLLLENAAHTGSEQVFVFGRCWKKLRLQSHCKRVERNLGQRRTFQVS